MNAIPPLLDKAKHEILLVSLLVLLFAQIFIPDNLYAVAQPFLFAQTIFAGIILFSDRKMWRNLFIVLIIFLLTSDLYVYYFGSALVDMISRGVYVFFFISISVETYRRIYRVKEVTITMITSVFSGFILLCLIGSAIFTIIELQHTNSFSNLGTPDTHFSNLSYFSFITTLTIGYGDIVPLTVQAKKAVMLFSLLGNFYTVFVTGIVIGKYLSNKESSESKK